MPNIRILAKAVLQLFCSQGCSCTKCMCLKRRVTQPKIYGMGSKVIQFIYTLVCNYMPNIRILAKALLQVFCSQGCSYTKCLCLKKRVTQPNIYGIGSKVNQFLYTLVCNYMPNIRILAKAVLQIFCSQGCSYTKCLCRKKGNNSTENLRNRFNSYSLHLHFNLESYAKYQDPSLSGSSDILFTRLFLYKNGCV